MYQIYHCPHICESAALIGAVNAEKIIEKYQWTCSQLKLATAETIVSSERLVSWRRSDWENLRWVRCTAVGWWRSLRRRRMTRRPWWDQPPSDVAPVCRRTASSLHSHTHTHITGESLSSVRWFGVVVERSFTPVKQLGTYDLTVLRTLTFRYLFYTSSHSYQHTQRAACVTPIMLNTKMTAQCHKPSTVVSQNKYNTLASIQWSK